ncbi:hypothetical protein [Streptomyces fungicidicus]|uniref:hypothetical protein n=1 Tax=Streptomyces fungicidicus TaxID=68203 RepID=UPI0036C9AD9F
MSTTRHHINRQRRRQARETRPPASAGTPEGAGSRIAVKEPAARTEDRTTDRTTDRTEDRTTDRTEDRQADRTEDRAKTADPRSRRPVGLVVLCVLTMLLGGFAGWAHAKAQSLRDDPARRNTALTDLARTSEIKGQTTKAVESLFSYDHADPAAFDKAARELLTGKAVGQHRTLLADVRERAGEQKAVITTSVTESAVERIDGDRARVLVYADQSSVATAGGSKKAADDEGVYAGAMLAVDVVRRDGRWLVSGIDTFGR